MLKIVRRACGPAMIALLALACPQVHAQFGGLVVTMTGPASGSTVSGTVPVSARVSAAGFLIVRGVQFKLDGADLGAEDASAPYSIPWNTNAAGNGPHSLTAVARDALGARYTSAPVTVTGSNAPPPDTTPPGVGITSPTSRAPGSGTRAGRGGAFLPPSRGSRARRPLSFAMAPRSAG